MLLHSSASSTHRDSQAFMALGIIVKHALEYLKKLCTLILIFAFLRNLSVEKVIRYQGRFFSISSSCIANEALLAHLVYPGI